MATDILCQADEQPWQAFGPGTWIKVLYVSEETGMWIALFKLDPDAVFSRHFHKGSVDFYLISGELRYRAGILHDGGFAFEPLGVLHEATSSDVETIVFAHFFGPVEFMDDEDNVIFNLDWKFVKENFSPSATAPVDARSLNLSYTKEPASRG